MGPHTGIPTQLFNYSDGSERTRSWSEYHDIAVGQGGGYQQRGSQVLQAVNTDGQGNRRRGQTVRLVILTLQAGQSYTCNLSNPWGSTGTYTVWADWLDYNGNWHQGQLGPNQTFTLASAP